jgi:hypothetical protein
MRDWAALLAEAAAMYDAPPRLAPADGWREAGFEAARTG